MFAPVGCGLLRPGGASVVPVVCISAGRTEAQGCIAVYRDGLVLKGECDVSFSVGGVASVLAVVRVESGEPAAELYRHGR